ncbi:MAG: hypothetical protein QME52_14215 [Bacteroidota bacterium]|nr:hypothetical protein [Bacteroidota bacterium]
MNPTWANSIMKEHNEKTVLVSIMNSKRDWEIACDRHWYRIPVRSAPKIVRTIGVRYLAFYLTKVFSEQAFGPMLCQRRKDNDSEAKRTFPERGE